MTRRSVSHLALLYSPLLMAAATYDPPVTPAWPGLNSSGAGALGVDIQELIRDANGGNPVAQFKLGELVREEGNSEAAFGWMRRAADQHFHPAGGVLARMLYRGIGTEPDPVRGAIRARPAADGGDANGQMVLGWLFAIGGGVEQSWPDAIDRSRRAAEQANARAQADLGWMLLARNGAPRDPERAISWYQKAAEQDDAVAETELGRMYAFAFHLPRDADRAATLFRRAVQ